MSDFDADDLVNDRVPVVEELPHKIEARKRFDILTEDYKGLIEEKIGNTHQDKTIKADLGEHIDLSTNLGLDITSAICVVWKHDAVRYVPGATDEQNEALRKLVLETDYHTHARSWNREAFFLGPVTVLPVLRGERMTFDTLLPHFYDTIDNPDNLWGSPMAALWKVLPNLNAPAKAASQFASDRETVAILLDQESWRYYGASKNGAYLEPIGSMDHGLGEFPGSTLSFERPHGVGRWDCRQHQRLVDATITISYLDACLGLVRKGQSQKILTLIGDLSSVPKGQRRHPEGPIVANTDGDTSQVQINALDFNTDPEYAIKHQAWKMQGIARSYGGQVASSPGTSSHLEAKVQFTHDALTEQRNEQIPFALEFERDLWAKTIRIAKTQRHPLADQLPDSEDVRESLVVEFPPLSRRFADIKSEIEWKDWALSKGIISHRDLIRPIMPGVSPEQLTQRIADNLDDQAPLIAKMTTRDQSMAPEASPANKTESQLNGEQGPAVRDSKD
ncbi:MAG: hypothetical protein ACRBBM_17470 [Pseudomonadaceae bacterium]